MLRPKEYVYPKRIYEGLEFFIDIDTFTLENTWVQNEFSIDFRKISKMFCPHGSTYISTATHETEEILKNYGNYMIFRPLLQSFK